MKDDFYKDIKHKRAQDEKSSKASAGNKKTGNQSRETLSRSARHKTKEAVENKQPEKKTPAKKKQQKESSLSDKLKGYFSAETAAKGKSLFAGKFSSYQNRIKNEIRLSKEKLGGISAAKNGRKKKGQHDNGQKKTMLPWVLAVLVLIPITILFAFLIFSNFWPSMNDEIELAGDNSAEETAGSSEEGEAEFNDELEAQKAEHESRLAANRNEDLTAKNIETDYSQEELQELEEAALSAIRSKEDGNDAEETEPEKEDKPAAEPETETETAEEEAESDPSETQNADASHVVTPEDNLYRIAIQYYGDGSAANVQRIMEANGVTPDSLTVGQELIIP